MKIQFEEWFCLSLKANLECVTASNRKQRPKKKKALKANIGGTNKISARGEVLP